MFIWISFSINLAIDITQKIHSELKLNPSISRERDLEPEYCALLREDYPECLAKEVR
ncbi:hypothetical protein MKW98_007377, partial [Papaver atlanticum]